MGGSTRKNKVLCWFFLSTKHVKNMPKRKSTQKTVAFSCFPQKSVLVCNRWKPYWMKLETVYFSKTISAEWQMLYTHALYIYEVESRAGYPEILDHVTFWGLFIYILLLSIKNLSDIVWRRPIRHFKADDPYFSTKKISKV